MDVREEALLYIKERDEKEARSNARLEWIRKNGWIVQTIVASIALIISIFNAIF